MKSKLKLAVARAAAVAAIAGISLTGAGEALAQQYGNLGISNVSQAKILKIDQVKVQSAGTPTKVTGGILGAAFAGALADHLIGNKNGQRNNTLENAVVAATATAGGAMGAQAAEGVVNSVSADQAFRILVETRHGNIQTITIPGKGAAAIKNEECRPGDTMMYSGHRDIEIIGCVSPSLQSKTEPTPSTHQSSRKFGV